MEPNISENDARIKKKNAIAVGVVADGSDAVSLLHRLSWLARWCWELSKQGQVSSISLRAGVAKKG